MDGELPEVVVQRLAPNVLAKREVVLKFCVVVLQKIDDAIEWACQEFDALARFQVGVARLASLGAKWFFSDTGH